MHRIKTLLIVFVMILLLSVSVDRVQATDTQNGTDEKGTDEKENQSMENWTVEVDENITVSDKSITYDILFINGTLTLINVSLNVNGIVVYGELYVSNSIIFTTTLGVGSLFTLNGTVIIRDSVMNDIRVTTIYSVSEFYNTVIDEEVYFWGGPVVFEGNWLRYISLFYPPLELFKCYNVSISNNIIQTGGYMAGLKIVESSNISVNNNIIKCDIIQTGGYGVGLEIEKSSNMSVNNNIIKSDIIKINSSNVTFDDNRIYSDNRLALGFVNSSITFVNNTFNSQDLRFSLYGNSHITTISTDVSGADIDIENKVVGNTVTNSTFTVKEYLKVMVVSSLGWSVTNAHVIIYDRFNTKFYEGYLGWNYTTPWILYTEYVLWREGVNGTVEKTSFAPNTIHVYVAGQRYIRLQEDEGVFIITLSSQEKPDVILNMFICLLVILGIIICSVFIRRKFVKNKRVFALCTAVGAILVFVGILLITSFKSRIITVGVVVYTQPYLFYGIFITILGGFCVIATFTVPILKHFKCQKRKLNK